MKAENRLLLKKWIETVLSEYCRILWPWNTQAGKRMDDFANDSQLLASNFWSWKWNFWYQHIWFLLFQMQLNSLQLLAFDFPTSFNDTTYIYFSSNNRWSFISFFRFQLQIFEIVNNINIYLKFQCFFYSLFVVMKTHFHIQFQYGGTGERKNEHSHLLIYKNKF